jgi:1-deoxy-D-xylulose-5-phosphate reductoisomerase
VAAFLDRRIGFLDIARVVAETLERMDRLDLIHQANDDVLEAAQAIDATARHVAGEVVSGLMARA